MRGFRTFENIFLKLIIALYALKVFEHVTLAHKKEQVLVPHKPGETSRTVFVPANSSCDPPPTPCDPTCFYSNFDGSCNNLHRSSLGQAGTLYRRLFDGSSYSDLSSAMPLSTDGSPLANPRELRLAFLPDGGVPSKKYTPMCYGMGQFLTHDLTSFNSLTPAGPCCTARGQIAKPQPKECIPIEISPNDPFYSRFGVRCLSVTRANSSHNTPCNLNQPNTAYNFVSGWIDLSMVYGTTIDICNSLREMQGGRLKFSVNSCNQQFFSMTTTSPIMSSADWLVPDQRMTVCPALAVCGNTFQRFHNVLASRFGLVTKNLDDDAIFYRCRRLLIACAQNTYYGEYLPSMLGMDTCKRFNLLPLKSGYTNYDPTIDGHTSLEYTICSRTSHRQVINGASYAGPNGTTRSYSLRNQFFDQSFLMQDTTFPDLVQTYERIGCNQQRDREVSALTEFLFQDNDLFGLDLGSIDILRCRDFGILGYNAVRERLGLGTFKNFDEMESVIINSKKNIKKLKMLYNSVNDADLYIMSSLEIPVTDAAYGPTCNEILSWAYYNSKFGDRFNFEHKGELEFSKEILRIIREVQFCHIVCWTNEMTPDLQIPENAYEVPSETNPAKSCAEILRSAPNLSKLVKLMAREGFPKKSNSRCKEAYPRV